jgi:4-amino-4-deoxy-L-arabinose transferase-like glycosyltransferase
MIESARASSAVPTPQPAATRAQDRSDLRLLGWVTLLSLGLFVGRPFNIDDPLFVWTARQIQAHPADFYGFELNWYDYAAPASSIIKNPPLTSYYLAAAGALFGMGETSLHVAMLLPNVALLVGIYQLARSFCQQPRFAALCALGTPALLVSATTVMCDTMMLAFWCWALVVWLAAMQSQRLAWFCLAGLLIGLSTLTKYFGVALVPLLLADVVVRPQRERGHWWLVTIAIPLFMLAAYGAYTSHLYGQSLFADAANYAQTLRESAVPLSVAQAIRVLIFVGGCFFTLLCFVPGLCSWREYAILVGLAMTLFVILTFWQQGGPLPPHGETTRLLQAGQAALFVTAALWIGWLTVADLYRRRDRCALVLALWIGGTVLFAVKFNWTLSARALLPLAPALGIVVARRWDDRPKPLPATSNLQTSLVAVAIALSMLVAWGDTSLARANKLAARTLVERYQRDDSPLWFQGHWGFQYYMQALGARHIDITSTRLPRGTRLAMPRNNAGSFRLPPEVSSVVDVLGVPVAPLATTVDRRREVNFYWSSGQALFFPILFGPTSPEEFYVLECQANIELSSPADAPGSTPPHPDSAAGYPSTGVQ